MIGRSDGGIAGGVLPLTDEMQQHGARPTWLGYIDVDDVDAAVAAIEAAGGKALMPRVRHPQRRPDRDGRRPAGRALLRDEADPARGTSRTRRATSSRPTSRAACRWNELSTSDPAAARDFYGEQFGWDSDDVMDMGEMGEYRFIDHDGDAHRRVVRRRCSGQQPKWRYYIRVPSIVDGQGKPPKPSGGTDRTWARTEVPGGDYIVIGIDPQGAEFALVGRASIRRRDNGRTS